MPLLGQAPSRPRVHLHNVTVGEDLRVRSETSVRVENIQVGGSIHVEVNSGQKNEGVSLSVNQDSLMGQLVDQVKANPRPVESQHFFQKRLHRDSENGKIGGVCEGLAEDFNLNPIWLRLAFVVLASFGFGLGVGVYVIAWVLLPDQTTKKSPELPSSRDEVPPELREAWREVNEMTTSDRSAD